MIKPLDVDIRTINWSLYFFHIFPGFQTHFTKINFDRMAICGSQNHIHPIAFTKSFSLNLFGKFFIKNFSKVRLGKIRINGSSTYYWNGFWANIWWIILPLIIFIKKLVNVCVKPFLWILISAQSVHDHFLSVSGTKFIDKATQILKQNSNWYQNWSSTTHL